MDLLHLFGAMLIAIFFHRLALFLFASLHPDFNIIEFLILGDLECFPFLTKQVLVEGHDLIVIEFFFLFKVRNFVGLDLLNALSLQLL